MKILVIYTNTYRMLAPAPLGASLVAARLRQDGHQVRFLDLMFAKDPAAATAQAAAEVQPDLIAYSIRNVDNQSASQFFDPWPGLQRTVQAVREACAAPSLLGGTAFTTFPASYLEKLGADYGIAGDDLEPISRFVASLAAGRPDLTLPGLVYREGPAIRANPFAIHGYTDVSFDGWDFIDYRSYRRCFSSFWDAGIVTRTGCPFECVFCDTYRTFGRQHILRDPVQVAEEALALQHRGVRSAFLADAGFNRPLDHAKAVLEAFIRAGVRLGLTGVFEPGEADEEFARLYRRAGGQNLMLFAMSLSDPVLDRMRKPFHLEDVLTGADTLRRAGVTCMLYLTLGGPGETPATVDETLARADRMPVAYTLLDHGFRVQPGTALRDTAIAEGAIAPDDDGFRPTFYHSPETPAAMLSGRIKRYQAAHRWDGWRMIPMMVPMLWNKLRP